MHFAAMRGSIDAAQWALGEGCAVDEVTADGLRPLHIAAARGHAAMVRWLVRARGADPVAPDARGSTPLHLGVSGPSDDVIVTLLLAGGEALASDHNGLTPLALAARRRTPQQLQQLQQQGAGPASPAATPLRPDIAEGRTLDDVSGALRGWGTWRWGLHLLGFGAGEGMFLGATCGEPATCNVPLPFPPKNDWQPRSCMEGPRCG
jgi:ankyrin repeat protein